MLDSVPAEMSRAPRARRARQNAPAPPTSTPTHTWPALAGEEFPALRHHLQDRIRWRAAVGDCRILSAARALVPTPPSTCPRPERPRVHVSTPPATTPVYGGASAPAFRRALRRAVVRGAPQLGLCPRSTPPSCVLMPHLPHTQSHAVMPVCSRHVRCPRARGGAGFPHACVRSNARGRARAGRDPSIGNLMMNPRYCC